MTENNELQLVLRDNNLVDESAKVLETSFAPLFQQAKEWKEKAMSIIVTSADQKEEMDLARTARLEIKKIRTDTEKTRKKLKEESLRRGKAIDGLANVIKFLIVPIEEHLEEQEKFVKIQEEKKKDDIEQERISLLTPFVGETTFYDLRNMTEEGFNHLLKSSETAYNARIEAEKKAEEERIAQEKKDAEERERIAKENEQLKKEAIKQAKKEEKEKKKRDKERAELNAKLEKERKERESKEKELQAKADKERKEREKLEAEIKAKEEAEKRKKEEEERKEREEAEAKAKAEEEARLAPDKKKLETLMRTISGIEIPSMSSEKTNKIVETVRQTLVELVNYIQKNI